MLGVGTVIGLAIGIGFGQLAESLLFELKGYDPAVLIIAAGVLTLVALAASALPAYRASRIDPMKALRYE
jgi:ABC-type antimicrobial peptide transport system permease subunit